MHRVSAKFVPRLLTDDQKLHQFPSVKISFKCHYRYWDVGSQLWRWNQTKILALEESCFVLAQEDTTGALMSESNVACFFQSLRHCALWIHSWKSDNQNFHLAVLRCLWDMIRRKRREMWTAWGGSSITIMHLLTQQCQLHNSWQNIQFLPLHNPHIHLTSPLWLFSIP
jgi:hypothetical protein